MEAKLKCQAASSPDSPVSPAVGSEDGCNTQDGRLRPAFHKSLASYVGRHGLCSETRQREAIGGSLTSTLPPT